MHTGATYWTVLATVSSWNNLQIKRCVPSVPSQLCSCFSQEILIYFPRVDFISFNFHNNISKEEVNQATVTLTELTINATKYKKLQETITTRNEVTVKISQ